MVAMSLIVRSLMAGVVSTDVFRVQRVLSEPVAQLIGRLLRQLVTCYYEFCASFRYHYYGGHCVTCDGKEMG